MKKLFALMLALCLLCSVALAEGPVELNWADVEAAAEEVGGQFFAIEALGLVVWAPNDFYIVNEIPEEYAERGINGMFAAVDEEGNLTGAITLQYLDVNGASVEECVAAIEGASDPQSTGSGLYFSLLHLHVPGDKLLCLSYLFRSSGGIISLIVKQYLPGKKRV